MEVGSQLRAAEFGVRIDNKDEAYLGFVEILS